MTNLGRTESRAWLQKMLATLISWSIPCISEEVMFSRQIIGVSKKGVERK